ncbi:CHAT domain-containing protein [Boletus edulis BED1]|uniref:CHAT domain-containing protein n=1 Tax=Boletus edulis BED1 TaxID=1328754 RepID=A0AAD4BPE7_BOLED|nr:CHAT domain-containing protein [Boletus edulis BED1]
MDPTVEQLHSRAAALANKFQQGGGTSYMDDAVFLAREALERRPPGHSERSVSLTQLAIHLDIRYNKLGSMRDLEEAIVLDREARGLRPQGHPDRWMSLNNLANPSVHPIPTARDRSKGLNNLAAHLSTRYSQLGAMEDLDDAIALAKEALDLCPKGDPVRSILLNTLVTRLSRRYDQFGVKEDLDKAIALAREALDLCPTGHPDRAMSLGNLALCLSTRYNLLGVMGDLDEAIILDRQALGLFQKGHPHRSKSVNNLASYLSTRYEQLGAMGDLDETIALAREALDLCPTGHPYRSSSLNNLAFHLSTRYNQLGVMEDLNVAIVLGREALELRPQGHPDRSNLLNTLALCLSARYDNLRVMEDLYEAIILDREALDLRPPGHPHRPTSLNNLAMCLSTRYKQLGVMENLGEAIFLTREAIDLQSKGHPDRSTSLDNLGTHLFTRYDQLRVMEDLDEAIVLGREALDLRPRGHPDRSMLLNNLAPYIATWYSQLRTMKDLDEAIVLNREALSFARKGISLDRSLNAMEDLNEAIVLHQEALDLLPKGHPDRSTSLNSLAADLTRYRHLGVMEDLDEAITFSREALHFRPQGHPERTMLLDTLTRCLRVRFTRMWQSKDKEELFSLYAQLLHLPPHVSSSDIFAAREWILVAEVLQHPTILPAYETSLRLLVQHLIILPSLPQHLDILKKLTSSLAVDAFSACLRNGSPAKAVELLEQGRGVFWSQLIRLRSPLDDVIASGMEGKELADEFTRLASLSRSVLDSPGTDQHEQLWHLNLEMQRVVANIRKLPGLSRFLLSPLFSDLQCAASGGPIVVVNASKYSCDALVILPDGDPVHIPLQITQENVRDLSTELRTLTVRATRSDMTRPLAAFLRKLWDQIISPIVDFLQTTVLPHSRIWWCPTGEFSVLPLHAASPFRKGQQSLSDLYISSYTPTLAALIRARRCDLSTTAYQQRSFVAVGQANAAGETKLLSVGVELEIIGQLVGNLATFTCIDGEESCSSRVFEELGKSEWVHFACHGLPNRTQPFKSAFALHDGHFTIQQIIGCDLKNPEFAYLSACHTTVGDEESPDEVIHLASAMQFIGFRSVIGTMWAVDDGETNKITSTFYKHMVDESGHLDHTRAAFALNKTMKSVHVPLDQRILYIHLGT